MHVVKLMLIHTDSKNKSINHANYTGRQRNETNSGNENLHS